MLGITHSLKQCHIQEEFNFQYTTFYSKGMHALDIISFPSILLNNVFHCVTLAFHGSNNKNAVFCYEMLCHLFELCHSFQHLPPSS
jgi:hypothetical protein